MFADAKNSRRQHSLSKRLPAFLTLTFSLVCAGETLQAQSRFSSGSTGADGAFAPTATQSIPVPDSGVFNFTTVNIPAGVTITFTRNATNTPVIILASGDVVIAGIINIDGKDGASNAVGGQGGPGGYDGGNGGYGFDRTFSGVPGDGPSGGGGGIGGPSITRDQTGSGGGGGFGTAGGNGELVANGGRGGPQFGAVTILPLIGGSGGGGGGAPANERGGPGGGGGGAILIASSGTITLNGQISANGRNGDGFSNFQTGGGGGAGGAVRLISNTLAGTGNISVSGGSGGRLSGGRGARGYVRIETFDKKDFSGNSTPAIIISFALPQQISPPNPPLLRIASVGGVSAPSKPHGTFHGFPDIIVPSSQPNVVSVAIEGTGLPLGTIVQVTVRPANGNHTIVQSTGLAGTEAASTATASLPLPIGVSVIIASAVADLVLAKATPIFMDGERVQSIEVAATFGGASELTYVTQSGRRIKRTTH